MEHFLHPRHTARLEEVSYEGTGGNERLNRYTRLQLMVRNEVVVGASFRTYGCAPAIAAASFLCEWCVGKKVAETQSMTADLLTHLLGGLPAGRRYCADLAVDALQTCIQQWKEGVTHDLGHGD